MRAGICPRHKIRVVGYRSIEEMQRQFLVNWFRQDLGVADDALLVGIVGRLVAVKSVDLYLRALGPLLAQFPGCTS